MMKKNKKNTRVGFICFRYIFPLGALLLMLILPFIPVYRYVTADSGVNQAISLAELIENSWNTVRNYLFDGGANKLEPTTDFSVTVLALIITFFVLFIVGALFAVWTAVEAVKYILAGDTDKKSRVLFLTLVPNRIFASAYFALTLPIFTFPMLMPLLYRNLLNSYVELIASPFDMFFVALALWGATAVVSAISARSELGELNVFLKKCVEEQAVDVEEEDTPDPLEEYSEIERRAIEEQAERIRKLLNKDTEE